MAPLTSPNHGAVYHLHGKASQLFVPALLLLAVSWMLISAALWLMRRVGWVYLAFWWGALCFLPWVGLRSIAALRGASVPGEVDRSLLAAGVFLWLIGLVWGWRKRDKRSVPWRR